MQDVVEYQPHSKPESASIGTARASEPSRLWGRQGELDHPMAFYRIALARVTSNG